jgi:hypothetical protein
LIWDNRKGRRLNRRLELERDTVETVRTWRAVRQTLDLPTGSEGFPFPPAAENGTIRHLVSEQISSTIRKWADSVPVLLSEEFDRNGDRVPFDRSLIHPYAFRHSFRQRYVDTARTYVWTVFWKAVAAATRHGTVSRMCATVLSRAAMSSVIPPYSTSRVLSCSSWRARVRVSLSARTASTLAGPTVPQPGRVPPPAGRAPAAA